MRGVLKQSKPESENQTAKSWTNTVQKSESCNEMGRTPLGLAATTPQEQVKSKKKIGACRSCSRRATKSGWQAIRSESYANMRNIIHQRGLQSDERFSLLFGSYFQGNEECEVSAKTGMTMVTSYRKPPVSFLLGQILYFWAQIRNPHEILTLGLYFSIQTKIAQKSVFSER